MPAEALHPMMVHFPIALLLVSLLVETLALFFKKPAWHRITLWNLVLGTWGALATVVTGGISAAVASPGVAPEVARALEAHTVWGMVSFLLAVTVNAWHLGAGQQMKRSARWMAWGLLFVTCGVVSYTGHLGARLVYQYGLVRVELP